MALLTTVRDLNRRKGRERRGLALAEGVRLVEEMLAAHAVCKGAVVSPALDATPRGLALRSALAARGIPIEVATDAELADLASTEHPQGVVAVYAPKVWTLDEFAPGVRRPIVVLDGVQDPGNVGTIARTAWAFGAAGLIALPGTADLTNPKVVRGAMGALFQLPHRHTDDMTALDWLASRGVAFWAATMDGDPVALGAPASPVALLLGNEGAGIRVDLLAKASRRVTIPIRPEAESLNVAAAAAILLHLVTQ